jgi:hypothetical protein
MKFIKFFSFFNFKNFSNYFLFFLNFFTFENGKIIRLGKVFFLKNFIVVWKEQKFYYIIKKMLKIIALVRDNFIDFFKVNGMFIFSFGDFLEFIFC